MNSDTTGKNVKNNIFFVFIFQVRTDIRESTQKRLIICAKFFLLRTRTINTIVPVNPCEHITYYIYGPYIIWIKGTQLTDRDYLNDTNNLEY